MLAAERTLAALASLLLGFYLLYGGRFFERLAFKESKILDSSLIKALCGLPGTDEPSLT